MELTIALLGLAAVHLLAVISPGQSFLFVTRTALVSGRLAALAATLGMGLGVVLWAAATMLGLAVLFEQAQWLYTIVRLTGGLYLLYLAIIVWRSADVPLGPVATPGREVALWPAFRDALLIQITNPKVVVFYGSIFAALLPPAPPAWVKPVILAIVATNEIGWFIIVSLLFSSERPRQVYLGLKPKLDRVMALLLGLIGARLIAAVR